ncbi:hypothetical protein HY640_02275 [Candidatus Woesearchaeota archaeon]|nr:hypothetical protein [Candidatus Woesearchaeota archaeon]
MKAAIVTSTVNPASANIREQLISRHGFREMQRVHHLVLGSVLVAMHSFDRELLFFDGMDKMIDADVFIFPYTHTSRAGVDAFAVHSVGNWGRAELGGMDRTLCPAPSALMKQLLKSLHGNSMGVEVIQEATHHGPFVGKPSVFVEIGSSSGMYSSPEAGRIVADAIVSSLQSMNPVRSAVGIGGLHHCPNFSRVMLNTDVSVAHVCPKYALGGLDGEMLVKALAACSPKANLVVLDWKGLGEHKDKIKLLVDSAGVAVCRTGDF